MAGDREWWDWKAVFEGGGRRVKLPGYTDAPKGSTEIGIKNSVLQDAPTKFPELRGMRCTSFHAQKRD